MNGESGDTTNWEHIKSYIRKQWSKLTDEDLDAIKTDRSALPACIRHRYQAPGEDNKSFH